MKRRLALIAVLAACPAAVTACGSQSVDVPGASASSQRGAAIFSERCGGCHTFEAAGTQGSATEVSDRERVDGPNFNVRKSCYEDALYAIENGGYSGAIMPANIVVGQDAKDVARFIAEYSGKQAKNVVSASGPAAACKAPPSG
jgi:mono/diheme cytochrome c family protein